LGESQEARQRAPQPLFIVLKAVSVGAWGDGGKLQDAELELCSMAWCTFFDFEHRNIFYR
jgi:hypothetical protein